MQFHAKTANPVKNRSQVVVVGLYDDQSLTPSAKLIDQASKGYIKKVAKRGDITGKVGQTLMLHDVAGVNAQRVLLVGLGNADNSEGPKYIKVAEATIAALKALPIKSALVCLLEGAAGDKDIQWKARRLVEQFMDGTYQLNDLRGKPPEETVNLETVDLLVADKAEQDTVSEGIAHGTAVAIGVEAAKTLGNTPANICTPTYLAEQSQQLAKDYASITTQIIDEKQAAKLGMNSFLSVGNGSEQPSKMIVMQHKGGKAKDAPHVLVGKGITFDTGGISLKPGGTMWEMIYDMCGAASVFGAMKTVAELNLPINVVAVIAAAENMPSDRATRPGDIVKSMSGQTIEILNTDAEGRLVLCDALTYVEKFKPATVIDVATLTGACVVALGNQASALYANDDELAANIDAAGLETHDRVWRMPLWEEYQQQLTSAFADMINIGGPGAGSITAACFLARFTKQYRWAHLDVAGTAFRGGMGKTKAATGRPVYLLTQYLLDRAAEA
ncbi:MAG: leucyl aminopeptidase [Pseudomonadales bacterium]